MTHVQVDYQTKEWYIIANILKYGSNNLIILYYYKSCIFCKSHGVPNNDPHSTQQLRVFMS